MDEAARLAADLKACATEGCKYCSRSLGYGCARDLKLDAAALLEKMKEETKECQNGR